METRAETHTTIGDKEIQAGIGTKVKSNSQGAHPGSTTMHRLYRESEGVAPEI